MFEEGKYYDGIVTKAGMTGSKNTGKPIIWFTVKTADGLVELEKVVSVDNLKYIVPMMTDCFGMGLTQMAAKDFADIQLPALTGSEVTVKVKSQPHWREGEPPIWIIDYMNPRGYRRKAASEETKAMAQALFASLIPGAAPAAGWPKDLPF